MKNLSRFSAFSIIAVFFGIFLFFACKEAPVAPNSTTTMSGVLVDEQGFSVPGAVLGVDYASISIQSLIAQDTTDEDGNFYFTKLPDDIRGISIEVTHPDFKKFTENLTDFKSKATSPVKIQHLDTCTGVINLTTYKKSDSTKLSDVEVRLFRNGSLIRKAMTKDGQLIFENVCSGTYIARFFRMGYELIYDSLHIYHDSISRAYYLQSAHNDSCCHGIINVTPMDSATNQPLVGATVNLYYGQTLLNTYKYQDAPISFTSLCPGQFYVHIEMTDYTGVGIPVTLKCNDTVNVQRGLLKAPPPDTCCKGIYKIFLIDKSTGKAPAHPPTVSISLNGQVLQSIVPTGGYVYFSKLCQGTFSIKISSHFYKEQTWDYTSGCNRFDTVTKYLDPLPNADSCCKGKICVTPLDSATHQPLIGAKVSLYIGSSLLNSYNYQQAPICFTGLCEGSYYVHLDMTDYNGVGIPVTIKCDDTVSIIRGMLKAPPTDTCCKGVYRIAMIDKLTGKAPVHGPTLTISQNGKVLQTMTSSNGVVYFSKLCQGDYKIELTSPYYKGLSWDYTSHCNSVDTITKYLDPIPNADSCCHGKIVVSIRDSANGNPIDTVKVQLSKNGAVIGYGYTSHGVYTFTGICPGDYSLYYYTKTGWTRPEPSTWNFTMACNDSAGFVRTLIKNAPDTCCKGTIVVNVNHTTKGIPVDSATVILSLNGTQIRSQITAGGKATFTHLCPGTYSFYYYKTNWYRSETPSWTAVMKCNDSQSFTKTMIPIHECCSGKISGIISDTTTGAPLANVLCVLYLGNTKIGTIYTDSEGKFIFNDICPGSYNLHMSIDAYYPKSLALTAGCNDESNKLSIGLVKK